MDPLSDIITLLKPRRLKTGAADVGGPFAVRMPQHQGLFCYAVLSGACWVALEDGAAAIRLAAGDCVILPSGRPFRIGSDPDLEPVDAEAMFAGRANGGVARYGRGGDCFLYAAHFGFDSRNAGILLSVLPGIVHIREEADREALRWSLDRMMGELRAPRPGSDLVVEHLAHLILVQALRLYLDGGDADRVGWLFALADARVGAVIAALHDAPARRWTVGTMAATAGMSRTAFAVRFKATVGMAPLEYLTRWRMLIAARAMSASHDTLASVAFDVGYVSESAFSTAFRRVMGCSPRKYVA